MFQKKPKSAPSLPVLANRGEYFNNKVYRILLNCKRKIRSGKGWKYVPFMSREQAWEYAKSETFCNAYLKKLGYSEGKQVTFDDYLLVR